MSDLTLSVSLPRADLHGDEDRCVDVRLYNASHLTPHLNREDRPDALIGHAITLVAALVPGRTVELSLLDPKGREHAASGASSEAVGWQDLMRLKSAYFAARCVPLEGAKLSVLPPGPYVLRVRYSWEASWPTALFRGLRLWDEPLEATLPVTVGEDGRLSPRE